MAKKKKEVVEEVIEEVVEEVVEKKLPGKIDEHMYREDLHLLRDTINAIIEYLE